MTYCTYDTNCQNPIIIKKLAEENKQLEEELKLYKKALELFVNWADECDFGYDNLGDLYSEYKDEIKTLRYLDGFIHIAVSEAKKELKKCKQSK